tara:strand:- start:3206 stop:3568 length:363 start_codon:yes stop_codon:yes gene_type:complete
MQYNDKEKQTYIKFFFDEDGQIFCDFGINDDLLQVDMFAQMLHQIFSGTVTGETLFHIYTKLVEGGREDVKEMLKETIQLMMDRYVEENDISTEEHENPKDRPVVNSTDLVYRIMDSKKQ